MIVHTTNTVPLQEVLPFDAAVKRNILICDSIETKGDFVCKTMAVEILKSSNVLWISGDAATSHISLTTQLKRMGCDVLRGQTNSRLTVRNVVTEMAEQVLENNVDFDATSFLKRIYRDAKEWIAKQQSDDDKAIPWILLDDVSGMATFLGDKTVYQFVDSLLALSNRRESFGLIIRCSSDLDQMIYQRQKETSTQQYAGWIGAGGLAQQHALRDSLENIIPTLERSLPTKVDAVIDVLPLPSGFSRDAHGRLIFSETPFGKGWGSNNATTNNSNLIVNYCVHDTGVRAMRLRTK